ncbi:hypothetical protein Bbelb_087630 [Branchiostoma belcheri]|nr:hypothetical protein Bbelb_087630 [Branchiostoma belcheri]
MRNCKLCSGWSLRIPVCGGGVPPTERAIVSQTETGQGRKEKVFPHHARSLLWKYVTLYRSAWDGLKSRCSLPSYNATASRPPFTFAERERVGARERRRHDRAINVIEAHQEVVGDSWRTKLCTTENEPDWRNKT